MGPCWWSSILVLAQKSELSTMREVCMQRQALSDEGPHNVRSSDVSASLGFSRTPLSFPPEAFEASSEISIQSFTNAVILSERYKELPNRSLSLVARLCRLRLTPYSVSSHGGPQRTLRVNPWRSEPISHVPTCPPHVASRLPKVT